MENLPFEDICKNLEDLKTTMIVFARIFYGIL